MRKKILALLLIGFVCQLANAAGVSIGATRLIYPSNRNQITTKIYNTDKTSNYLIQSWVSDAKGNRVNDFVITPPLFVLKANTDSVLRVVYTGDKSIFPADKETVFFFNSKVIPSLTEEEQQIQNALLISTTTKIKLFMRPESLVEGALDAYKNIQCSYANNKIKIDNPTPYYMNLVSLRVNGKEISSGEMVPPKDAIYIKSSAKSSELTFNVINDYGTQIVNQVCHL